MSESIEKLPRRDFLLASGGLALAAGVSAGAAEEGHEHHGGGKFAALAQEAQHCITTGNACISHCIMDMRAGSLELTECLASVMELVSICTAIAKFAALESEHVPAVAAVTKAVCISCEEECRKFADKHEVCADCADACLACIEECDKVIGAA